MQRTVSLYENSGQLGGSWSIALPGFSGFSGAINEPVLSGTGFDRHPSGPAPFVFLSSDCPAGRAGVRCRDMRKGVGDPGEVRQPRKGIHHAGTAQR